MLILHRLSHRQMFRKKSTSWPCRPMLINKQDSKALGIPVVPYTILVSADGLFVDHFYGIAPWENRQVATQVRHQFGLK